MMTQAASVQSAEDYRLIDIRPISGALGAEILGVDLSAIGDDAFDEIYRAFVAYQVIVFRDQNLTTDQYLAFAKRWGKIAIYPYMEGLSSHPEILEVLKTESDTYAFGSDWHTDGIFSEIPPKATMLYALEVPPAGGDTEYGDLYAAYETLSDGMKALLAGQKGFNRGDKKVARFTGLSEMKRKDPGNESVDALHPVIRTHPDTGRQALFISGHTVEFDGMTPEESAPLIRYLRHHAARPEFTCRIRWQVGSLGIWDNRCTQHNAINDYAGHRRRMHRIIIDGEEAPY